MSHKWHERRLLPWLVDIACGIWPIWRQRSKVVPLARGRELEIGIGTGLNLEQYDKAKIGKIVGLDPGLEMQPQARRRSRRAGLQAELIGLSAEETPCEGHSFDTVVATYVLCTISDPGAALREMRRVLRPGGEPIFCEHGTAPDPTVRRLQGLLTPAWAKAAGGCPWTGTYLAC